MNPMLHIRKVVLGISQSAMAEIAGVSQGTISKWETGELEPDRDEMAKIRRAILRRKIKWDDAWFFAPPVAA